MKYKAIKFFGISALLLLPLWAGAQQQPQSEEEELKQLREAIDRQVDSYTDLLDLEDWQTFYLDSILTTTTVRCARSSRVCATPR